MNIIYLILLWYFVSTEGARPMNVVKSTSSNEIEKEYLHASPPNNVQVKIINDETNVDLAKINLKLTKRSLANKYLPIWIMNGAINLNNLKELNKNDLKPDYNIMKLVGEFSTYQQPETSSAAVYFHNCHKFDGMIDSSITIRGLPVKYLNPQDETRLKLNKHGITINPQTLKHGSVNPNNNPSLHSGVNSANNDIRTFNSRVYDGYPELLVVVTSDMIKYITNGATYSEADLHVAVVSYVITLFNGVDMLYSKLQQTKIQINIAGIIIGINKKSFSFLDGCFVDMTDEQKNVVKKMDGNCVMGRFNLYLRGREQIIKPESYDIVAILTGHDIIYMVDAANKDLNKRYRSVKGLSIWHAKLYEHRKTSPRKNIAAIVNGKGYFESYPVIAHEIGHTLSVYHDAPPYITDNEQCCGKLMKADSSRCKKCLSWGESSEKTFKLFFSSPNCCIFINKPGSLLPPGRHQMLTADEQCQCYGFKSTKEFKNIPDNFCKTPLQCKDENNKYPDTIIPTYGTPCGSNMVCSENNCQKIEIFTHA